MKKNKTKRIVILGAICILLVAVSSWFTITFNEGRFIAPMDFSAYSFRIKDLPMIFSGILITIYFLYLVVMLIQVTAVNKRKGNNATITRNLNPKLGLLGFLGVLGFLGFWTYSIDKTIFPFVFFMFFGFFGFFYEGKLSNTFMDERYQENKIHAHSVANKTALTIIFLVTLILGQGKLMGNLEYTFITYIIIVSLAIALEVFLSEFLLYHYDHDDPIDESED